MYFNNIVACKENKSRKTQYKKLVKLYSIFVCMDMDRLMTRWSHIPFISIKIRRILQRKTFSIADDLRWTNYFKTRIDTARNML